MREKFWKWFGAGLASVVLAGAVEAGEISSRFHQSPDYNKGRSSRFHQSPDYNKGRKSKIDTIVLHTNEGSGEGAENWLTTKDKVSASAHYLIMENGEVVQLVKEEDTAWQCKGYNSRSIGIEFAGHYDKLLNPEQIKVGRQLIKSLMGKYKISKTNIKAHSELDSSRRKDPGKQNMEAILSGIETESRCKVSQIYSDFKYREELPVILETAKRVGVEPELMLAIRMAENGREGLEFGIIPTKKYKETIGYMENGKLVPYRNPLEKQASWCAWTIKKNAERYKESGGKGDFIGYLQTVYSPINEKNPNDPNRNWEKNVRYYDTRFKASK